MYTRAYHLSVSCVDVRSSKLGVKSFGSDTQSAWLLRYSIGHGGLAQCEVKRARIIFFFFDVRCARESQRKCLSTAVYTTSCAHF